MIGANFAALLVLGKWHDTHYQLAPLMFLLLFDLFDHPSYPYVYVLFTLAATLQVYVAPVGQVLHFLLYVGLLPYFLIRAWSRPVASAAARLETSP